MIQERLGSLKLEIDEHSRDSELLSPTLALICYVYGSHQNLVMLCFYMIFVLSEDFILCHFLFLIGPSLPFDCSLHVKVKVKLKSHLLSHLKGCENCPPHFTHPLREQGAAAEQCSGFIGGSHPPSPTPNT